MSSITMASSRKAIWGCTCTKLTLNTKKLEDEVQSISCYNFTQFDNYVIHTLPQVLRTNHRLVGVGMQIVGRAVRRGSYESGD